MREVALWLGCGGGIVGLLVLCLLGRRLFVLQAMSYEVLGCRACVVPNVLASDVPYWAVVVALFVVSFGRRGWLWRGVWRGCITWRGAVRRRYVGDVPV